MESLAKILLLPISAIYYLITAGRNFLYTLGIFSSKNYSFPVICVGNLSVGGTGKTPHIEFLISLLSKNYKIATLSRGYGRKTKGYRIASEIDNASTIGDEPFQLFKKFKTITVAVDEKRKRGINKLRADIENLNIVLLDDAYQHRSVEAGLSILLTDYSRLYINDYILPSGRLRESRKGASRANVIVVTKSPTVLSPIESRRISNELQPGDHQKVFFSYIDYCDFVPFNAAAKEIEGFDAKEYNCLMVSAIANSNSLLEFLNRKCKELQSLKFRDHHFFTATDYGKIKLSYSKLLGKKKAIIITEKDAVKFDAKELENIPIFVLPIKVKFHPNNNYNFEEEILKYVRAY